MRIQLPRGEWEYDQSARIGTPGGFGEVFRGESAKHGLIAVKRLKMSAAEAAHREMDITSDLAGKSFQHVIPILDCGLDADSGSYFVVMPLADRSLQDFIAGSGRLDQLETMTDATLPSDQPAVLGRGVDEEWATKILYEIASGLKEVEHLVHRDLKPLNVLYHDGAWKLADFGIARFVEDSTSTHTLQGHLSPPYAAPEQWQDERATNATDVYALGCIGYVLLTGSPPFTARGREDLRRAHLEHSPRALSDVAPRLTSLLHWMLRKQPAARPALDFVINTLWELRDGAGKQSQHAGLAALSQVAAKLQSEAAASEAQKLAVQSKQQQRVTLAKCAEETLLGAIIEPFFGEISKAAPNCKRSGLSVELGNGRLSFKLRGGAVPGDAFERSNWDVVAAASVVVIQSVPRYEWSSSLWYMKHGKDRSYRWREVSYFCNPMVPNHPEYQPYHLTDRLDKADEAAAPALTIQCIAYGPVPIDDDGLDDFIDRWINRFAAACETKLTYPRRLPLQ